MGILAAQKADANKDKDVIQEKMKKAIEERYKNEGADKVDKVTIDILNQLLAGESFQP